VAIHELTHDDLAPVKPVTFASQNIREREDLQRILRMHIEVVAPDTFVIAEEFADWEDSSRSIDLLPVRRLDSTALMPTKATFASGLYVGCRVAAICLVRKWQEAVKPTRLTGSRSGVCIAAVRKYRKRALNVEDEPKQTLRSYDRFSSGRQEDAMNFDQGELSPSGVQIAADFRDNLIIDRYDPVFADMRASKLKHLRSANSEDAVTWNVFRSLRQITPEAWLTAERAQVGRRSRRKRNFSPDHSRRLASAPKWPWKSGEGIAAVSRDKNANSCTGAISSVP
jgi:hypothetical protein